VKYAQDNHANPHWTRAPRQARNQVLHAYAITTTRRSRWAALGQIGQGLVLAAAVFGISFLAGFVAGKAGL
jgi:hypothetical protein